MSIWNEIPNINKLCTDEPKSIPNIKKLCTDEPNSPTADPCPSISFLCWKGVPYYTEEHFRKRFIMWSVTFTSILSILQKIENETKISYGKNNYWFSFANTNDNTWAVGETVSNIVEDLKIWKISLLLLVPLMTVTYS